MPIGDFLKKLTGGKKPPPIESRDEGLRVAATALLFRALYVDGKADPAEEEMIKRIVREGFGIEGEEAENLMKQARASAQTVADLHGWTRRINREYGDRDKKNLMELLWRVVLADGVIDHHEHALMRRIAGLIYVSDRDSAAARKRAAAAIGIQE